MAKLHLILKAFTLLFSLLASNVAAEVGIATFFTDQSRLACPGFGGQRKFLAAVNSKLWRGGSVCGMEAIVECLGAAKKGDRNPCKGNRHLSLPVRDFCEDCEALIDLSAEAFAELADKDVGEILVNVRLVKVRG